MQDASTILKARQEQRLAARTKILNPQSASSIDTSVGNTSIKTIELNALSHRHPEKDAECYEYLPREIDDLIQDKDYRRKYRSMIKKGFLKQLLALVRYTREMEASGKLWKRDPQRFFSDYASNANWERTCETLTKVAQVQKTAAMVAAKIGVAANKIKGVYKYVWQGVNVERWADLALEMPHDKPGQGRVQHFVWLCRREVEARAVAIV